MGKKVYAIKEGFDSIGKEKVENKIVNSWNECLKYVNGVKGAKYKSFENMEDALEYLKENNKLLKKGQDDYPLDCLHIYVDGSYNISTEKFSYGMAAVEDDVILHLEKGCAENSSQKQLRQIAGELEAAKSAVKYAAAHNKKKLIIFHDYEGIYHHAVGTWERKDNSSKEYYEFINSMIKDFGIEVYFVKVDSHTGDIYNEIADNLAKFAAGMDLTPVLDKWLQHNDLKVINDSIKKEMSKLISSDNVNKINVLKNAKVNESNVADENLLEYVVQLAGKKDEEILEKLNGINEKNKSKLILSFIRKFYT
jgi:ribonuclease H-related protein